MFTGIVEHVGRIVSATRSEESGIVQFVIDVGPIVEGVGIGDSIAVLGACLTATEIEESAEHNLITFEAIPETLERTRLADLAAGTRVNLERAMSASARFDGHMVQGHIDGVGRVRRFSLNAGANAAAGGAPGGEPDDEAGVELHIECAAELAEQLVDKGSVTIDGVSLTVVATVSDGFHVALIPHTLAVTTLSDLIEGSQVNLEVDVFGKYVKQYLDRILPGLVSANAS